MNFQPMLACGGGPLILLIVFAPVLNCAVTFIAGAICSNMGKKGLGGWIMGASAVVGAVSFLVVNADL